MRRINIKLLFIYVVIFILLFNVNNVYSRYISSSEDNVSLNVSSWSVLVNDVDITNESSSSIRISPFIINDSNTKNNTFAPGSNGYFDVLIDCSNVTTSFSYTITASMLNTDSVSNLGIVGVNILTTGSNPTTLSSMSVNKTQFITGTKLWDETVNFSFAPFTVRVYFKWNAVDDATVNNEDSAFGKAALSGDDNSKIKLNVNLSFKQYIE